MAESQYYLHKLLGFQSLVKCDPKKKTSVQQIMVFQKPSNETITRSPLEKISDCKILKWGLPNGTEGEKVKKIDLSFTERKDVTVGLIVVVDR